MNDTVTQTTLMLISHEAPSQSRMSQRKWYPGGVRPKQGWNRRQQSSRSSSSSSSSNRSHPPVNPFNMKLLLLHLCLALHGASEAHEYYDGACPDFPAMENLDWSRWASGGVWRAALKHNSRSSCIRWRDTLTLGVVFKSRTPVRGSLDFSPVGSLHWNQWFSCVIVLVFREKTSSQAPRCASWKADKLISSTAKKIDNLTNLQATD